MHQLLWLGIGAGGFTAWKALRAVLRDRHTETTIFTPVPSQRRSVEHRVIDSDEVAGFVEARLERLDKSPRVH